MICDYSAVKCILQQFRDIRRKPVFFSHRSKSTGLFKFILDFCHAHSSKVHIIYHSYCLCLFGVDHKIVFINTIISENISIAIKHPIIH